VKVRPVFLVLLQILAVLVRGELADDILPPIKIPIHENNRVKIDKNGFLDEEYDVLGVDGLRMKVRQVPGDGNCLFHALGVSLAFAVNGTHPKTDLRKITPFSTYLRECAVDFLTEDLSRPLKLEGTDTMTTMNLLQLASVQMGVTPEKYCRDMRTPCGVPISTSTRHLPPLLKTRRLGLDQHHQHHQHQHQHQQQGAGDADQEKGWGWGRLGLKRWTGRRLRALAAAQFRVAEVSGAGGEALQQQQQQQGPSSEEAQASSAAGRTSPDDLYAEMHLEGDFTDDDNDESRRWGGGPEIVSLANFLKRPIHVYELMCTGVGRNSRFCFHRVACFGSPWYDDCSPLHVLSADSRFPHLRVGKQSAKGNHFLALFPVGPDGSEVQDYVHRHYLPQGQVPVFSTSPAASAPPRGDWVEYMKHKVVVAVCVCACMKVSEITFKYLRSRLRFAL